jgi:hypothetical protein
LHAWCRFGANISTWLRPEEFDIENASNEWLDLYIQLALADGRRENVIPALDGVCVVRKGGTALLILSESEKQDLIAGASVINCC